MAVLMLREAAEETAAGESTIAIESGCMSAELTEGGAPNVLLRQLPAPETIAISDLAAKLAPADAVISNIQRLLAYPLGDADRHPYRPPVMALAPNEIDRLEELYRERVADAATEAALDDVWNGLIEVEANRFDSQDTFDRFQRMDDEARARIRNRNR
jgi:hypothetical protein